VQQTLNLQMFLQKVGRCTRCRVGSNLAADTRTVYRPYAVYDRSAGERRALHLVIEDLLVAQVQKACSQLTYHASKLSVKGLVRRRARHDGAK
jgi:hypothetical protein